MSRRQPRFAAHAAALVLLLSAATDAQLSRPVHRDSRVDEAGNKFLQRQADRNLSDEEERMAHIRSKCPLDVRLRWMAEASSSVYTTPLITDLYSDGHKDIIVPSFVHYLEVLEGGSGAPASGWPAFHASSGHASPLLMDVDADGVLDILLATYDGEVLFFKDSGKKMLNKLYVPRLAVQRDWFKGLDMDPLDRTHADVNDEATLPLDPTAVLRPEDAALAVEQSRIEAAAADARRKREGGGGAQQPPPPPPAAPPPSPPPEATPADEDEDEDEAAEQQAQDLLDQGVPVEVAVESPEDRESEQHAQDLLEQAQQEGAAAGPEKAVRERDAPEAVSDELQAGEGQGGQAVKESEEDMKHTLEHMQEQLKELTNKLQEHQADSKAPTLKRDGAGGGSRSLLQLQQDEEQAGVELGEDVISQEAADAIGTETQEADPDGGDLYRVAYSDEELDEYHWAGQGQADYAYSEYEHIQDYGAAWEDEGFRVDDTKPAPPGNVWLDPHIMCNPVLGDIDGDGLDELVLAVSYFFDRDYYDDPQRRKSLPHDVDVGDYVAGGIVVFDPRAAKIRWSVHLDLSTDHTRYRAYVYSAPVLADINGDGQLDIVVATSMGFVYVLDNKGQPLPGWPVQMGDVQGTPLVADFNGDGHLEVFAGDDRGNIALFDRNGTELWERHVRALVAQGATAGDVDDDGQLDIVFGTAAGVVFALNGRTGEDLQFFPFRTGGRIMAPVLITKLDDVPGQSLVVMSFDGHLYMIGGTTGCAHTVDIGETSYSMVLADDVTGSGTMDLVVTTMNGNVYLFETAAPLEPLAVWPAQMLGPNGQVARRGYEGILAHPTSRRRQDLRSSTFTVKFNIVDERQTILSDKRGYTVQVLLQGVGVKEMASGDVPVIGMSETYSEPGTYSLELPCPLSRASATVLLRMKDGSGMEFTDSYTVSFHVHFYKLLKWLLVIPFTLMVAVLLSSSPNHDPESLPS